MARRRNERGSALMELMLCLLPYGLVMLGALFLWYVQTGKQEVFKYLTSAAMAGGGGVPVAGRVQQGRLLTGSVATYDQGAEDVYNVDLDVDATRDEPVMPYDPGGTDLAAALTRGAISVNLQWDGTINVHATESGNQLARAGLIEGLVTGQGLDLNTDLSFNINMEAMQDLSASFAARDFQATLARGAAYQYTASGSGALPFETTLERWRRGTLTFGGGETESALWLGAGDPDVRGMYEPGTGWNLDAAGTLEAHGDEGGLGAFMGPYVGVTSPVLYDKDAGMQ